MGPAKSAILIVIAALLAAVIIAQAIPRWIAEEHRTLDEPLEEALVRDVSAWHVRDLPLGQTEQIEARSRAILNFDDYVYREYTRGRDNFSLYLAYWAPGSMPVRLVNAHTPDRCWTWMGWSCTDMEFAVARHSREAGELLPAERRTFEKDHDRIHVVYWHIVGGEVHTYRRGFNEAPPITVILQDLMRYGVNLRREQFFVRITSSHSLDRIWDDAGFQEVLGDVARLCLIPDSRAAQL